MIKVYKITTNNRRINKKGEVEKYLRHINKKKEAANKVLSFHKKTKLVLENYHKGLIIEDVEFSGEIDQQKKRNNIDVLVKDCFYFCLSRFSFYLSLHCKEE